MTFFSLLAALVIEHWRPRITPFPHYELFASFASMLREKLDGGDEAHGWLAWVLAVLPFAVAVWLIQAWLLSLWLPLAWIWAVGVLYFTSGFKYYAMLAEAIALDLRSGQRQQAMQRLEAWNSGGQAAPHHPDIEVPDDVDIASITIRKLFSDSLRQTFGIAFWFALLGPMGAVLYRLASFLERRWYGASDGFRVASHRIFLALNWVPARLSALTYAVAGNFEDAMYCWRTQAVRWRNEEEGIVMCAGAGAMGIKLSCAGMEHDVLGTWDEPGAVDAGLGEVTVDADQIDSAISMIWRGIMVWLAVGMLLLLASLA